MTDTAPTPADQAHPEPQARQQQRGRSNPGGNRPTSAPRVRPVHPVLQKLFELYPNMFGARFLPLKLGVFQELLAQHPDEFKREDLKIALGLHARSMRYLESVASGLPRHDLQGVPVEPVAPEHVHHAILEVFRRRQARSNEDLRPYVRAQLMRAVEASGLSREDYLLCVRQQDEVSDALLADVFAELGEQAARRDALLRLFEASAKTVAEFADMYGMDPAEVTQTLERARQAQAVQVAQAIQVAEAAANAHKADAETPVAAGEAPASP
jgi:ProP effector